MIHFLQDMISFLKTLSFIDYILYFAILILIILIISLIYIMKMNDDDLEPTIKKIDTSNDQNNIYKEEENNLSLETDNEIIDLREIVNTIDEKPTPVIDMTAFEAEQEEKAIISYDELIKNVQNHPINYDAEKIIDDTIKVKKINIDNLTNLDITEEPPRIEVKLFTYDHEEAFLKTLKQLNELLN
ncbi:MAG: hypothetical protein HFI09_03455 [Bacilli bacterium]|nr:hypothetical protein [Bacilli bacterium]